MTHSYEASQAHWDREVRKIQVALRKGRYQDAEAALQSAGHSRESLPEEDPRVALTLELTCDLRLLDGKAAAVLQASSRSLEHKASRSARPEFAESYLHQAAAFLLLDAFEEHQEAAAAALELAEQHCAPGSAPFVRSLLAAADALQVRGEHAAARELLERAWEAVSQPEETSLGVDTLLGLAHGACRLKDYPAAERYARAARAREIAEVGPNHPLLIGILDLLAKALHRQELYAEETEVMGHAARILTALTGGEEPLDICCPDDVERLLRLHGHHRSAQRFATWGRMTWAIAEFECRGSSSDELMAA